MENGVGICCNVNYIIDSSQIIRRSQISSAYKYAEGKRQDKENLSADIRLNYVTNNTIYTENWYPQPAVLYTHTEDINPAVRIKIFEKQKCELKKQKYVKPANNYISSDKAQIQYLETNPVCFLVCGKPSLGEQHVAKALADYWNCCYLDPITVIQQEIDSKSRTGRFIEFNLRSGRSIGGDIILNLIKRLVKSSSCRHRGFVISGLPIIPNELFVADEPLASESAVNVADQIINNLITTVSGHMPVSNVSEEEVQFDEMIVEKKSVVGVTDVLHDLGSLVSDGPCLGKSQKFDLYSSLKKQLNEVLNCFQRPFIIIYLKCPITEALLYREKFRYDIDSQNTINLLNIIKDNEMRRMSQQTFHYKRLVTEVRESARNLRDELEHYEKYVQPILDKFILNHDQQYVITIDARLPLASINETIKLKLCTLPLQKVLTVEKFSDIIITETAAEEEEEENEENDETDENKLSKIPYDFTDKTIQDVYKDFQNFCIVGPRYRWQLSHWGYYCPVALRYGRMVEGNPMNAVRFMNQIFFLENSYAMCLFCRNPRPFLLPPNPQIPSKIFLFGAEHCGVEDVAKCLSYVFNMHIIDVNILMSDLKNIMLQSAVEEYRKLIVDQQLNEIHDELIKNWKEHNDSLEAERNLWINEILKIYAIYQQTESDLTKEADVTITMTPEQCESILVEKGLPIDSASIIEILENRTLLEAYVPESLKPLPEPGKPTVLDKDSLNKVHEIIELYAVEENKVIVISDESLISCIFDKIQVIERDRSETANNHVKKTGWIIINIQSAKILSQLIEKGFTPNVVLYFYDNDVDNKFLNRKYTQKKFAPYHLMKDFLELNGYKNAAKRCPKIQYTPEIIKEFSQDILHDILKSERFMYVDKRRAELKTNEKIAVFGEDGANETNSFFKLLDALQHFEGEWDSISVFLSQLHIEPKHINYARDIEDVMLEAIEIINSDFRMKAYDFDYNARELEALEFRVGGVEEEMDEENDNEPDLLKRRLGDTLYYCPIALLKHNVLWQGKSLFGATYENKIYFFSSEHAKEQFLERPLQYVPLKKSIKSIPPLRICIVGPIASGKTTIGKMLAKQLGLIYVDYVDMVNKYCLPRFVRAGRKNKDVYIRDNVELQEYAPNEQEQASFDVVTSYFDEQKPLPKKYLSRILLRLWQSEPYCACGIVLEGFPYCSSDFEYMIDNYIIPDMVISLRVRFSVSNQRILGTLITEWKEIREKVQLEKEKEYAEILRIWKINHTKYFNNLFQIKVQERIQALIKGSKPNTNVDASGFAPDIVTNSDVKGLSMKEAVIEAKHFEETDKRIVLDQVNQDLPQPEFVDDLETLAEAEQRLLQFLEDSYAIETALIKPFENLCSMHSIKYFEVNANRSSDRILVELLLQLDSYKMRNESFLEITFPITMDESERLLNTGYYFLSNYGYWCPVQIYRNTNTIQQFLPNLKTNEIFPIIHRQYIYFLNGKINLKLFQENPLKYTERTKNYPIIAFRIAVLGPPKCGKTFLANRYVNEFGFKVVSRGEAIRYILRVLPHTLLACKIDKQLREGKVLDYDLVTKAVEVYCSEGIGISQGIVFDGFPVCSEEMTGLYNAGLMPHLVINLQSTYKFSKICLSNDNHDRGIIPLYSPEFMKYRYCKWYEIEKSLTRWIHKNFQNIYFLPCKFTRWSLWTQAKKLTLTVFTNITDFVQNFNDQQAWRLKYLSVTPYEMKLRLSNFRNYCVCCWTRKNYYEKFPMPVNRNQLVQFQSQYFCLCSHHLELFLTSPLHCSFDYSENIGLPTDLPIDVGYKSTSPLNNLKSCKLYEDGYCISCYMYATSFHRLVNGSLDYVVLYKGQYYSFCSIDCQMIFMRQPEYFNGLTMHFKKNITLPIITANSLPTMGYLQQTQSRYLVEACTRIGLIRPKYPKLTSQLSAIIYFGLFLKINNPKTKINDMNAYRKCLANFEQMCYNLKLLISKSKTIRNPYLDVKILEMPSQEYNKNIKTMSNETISNDYWVYDQAEGEQSLLYHDFDAIDDGLTPMLMNELQPKIFTSEIVFFTP